MLFNASTVLLSRQCSGVYKIGKLVTQQHPVFYSGCNISSGQCLSDFKISNCSSSSRRSISFSCKDTKNSLPVLHRRVVAANCVQYDQTRAAGHAKWQNIKSTKDANDQQRGRVFSRIAIAIKMSLKDGSTNPVSNPKLAAALEEAKSVNMPKTTINKILERSQKGMQNAKEYFLEFKGPGGLVLYINVFTDNLKRAKTFTNTVTKKYNFREEKGSGSVRHMFDERGIIVAPAKIGEKAITFSEAEEHAIEAGAEEVELHEDVLQFTCSASDFHSVRKALDELGYTIDMAEVEYLPKSTVTLDDAGMESLTGLIGKLEDLEEVVCVYVNA